MMPGNDGSPARFATTQWSLVLAAGERGAPPAEDALARLCAAYWYPIFAFVRRRGYEAADAQDLTQGFFTRLVEKGDLASADRTRGRFRTFLLTACQHFLSNERDRVAALKRGGGRTAVSIDAAQAEGRYERALSHADTPEHLYDRQWCLTLLDRVLEALREEYEATGRRQVFDRLKRFLTGDSDTGTHAEAALDLGMTVEAVKVNVHRLRKRYREALKRHVADTVASTNEVEDEIRYLFKTLAGPPGR